MVSRTHSWANTGKHYNLDFLACHKGIPEYHGQLTLTEWNMLSLRCLTSLLIQSSHALLQSKKRLVYFGSFSLSFFVVALAVLSTLTTSQVNKEKFAALSNPFFLNFNLSYSMTSAGGIVCLCCVSSSYRVALLNKLKNVVVIVYKDFLETSNLNNSVFVFLQLKHLMIVK